MPSFAGQLLRRVDGPEHPPQLQREHVDMRLPGKPHEGGCMMVYNIIKFFHILSVVFMSTPLYNLIVVNERVLFGNPPLAVDTDVEDIIKEVARRCYDY